MKKHKTKDKKPMEDNATMIQRNRNQKQKTLGNNTHNPIKKSKAIPENCIQHLEAEFKECCSLPMAHWGRQERQEDRQRQRTTFPIFYVHFTIASTSFPSYSRTHTRSLHFLPCSNLLNSVSHHLSGISYSLCGFCVQIISPTKLLGFLGMWLQKKKHTYTDQINGEVQQTLKESL